MRAVARIGLTLPSSSRLFTSPSMAIVSFRPNSSYLWFLKASKGQNKITTSSRQHSNEFADTPTKHRSKFLATVWRNLSPTERKQFEQKASQEAQLRRKKIPLSAANIVAAKLAIAEPLSKHEENGNAAGQKQFLFPLLEKLSEKEMDHLLSRIFFAELNATAKRTDTRTPKLSKNKAGVLIDEDVGASGNNSHNHIPATIWVNAKKVHRKLQKHLFCVGLLRERLKKLQSEEKRSRHIEAATEKKISELLQRIQLIQEAYELLRMVHRLQKLPNVTEQTKRKGRPPKAHAMKDNESDPQQKKQLTSKRRRGRPTKVVQQQAEAHTIVPTNYSDELLQWNGHYPAEKEKVLISWATELFLLETVNTLKNEAVALPNSLKKVKGLPIGGKIDKKRRSRTALWQKIFAQDTMRTNSPKERKHEATKLNALEKTLAERLQGRFGYTFGTSVRDVVAEGRLPATTNVEEQAQFTAPKHPPSMIPICCRRDKALLAAAQQLGIEFPPSKSRNATM